MTITYWGPHFPDSGGGYFWDGHFPDSTASPENLTGYGPPGSASFALEMETGFSVTYEWVTDVIKKFGGKEQRIATMDSPKEFYRGVCHLLGNSRRSVRAALARYVAIGSNFLLGLPHEELSLVADASDKTCFVSSTDLLLCDWSNPGQRVLVMDADGDYVGAVIQSTDSGSITLDVAPGDVGRYGGKIMPARAILLESQQGFMRHPVNAEEWQLDARASIFDFAPTLASLALGPLTTSASLENAVVTSRLFGLYGNQVTFALDGDPAHPATGQLFDVLFGTPLVLFRYRPGVTTFQNLVDALQHSSYVIISGVTDLAATMQAGDEMGDNLAGAADKGPVGTGATVTTYADHPVWDQFVQVDKVAPDALIALTEIVDMNGVPYSIGTADYADWGRHIMMKRSTRAAWQWLKKFLDTVRGRQRAFWLSSWRDDFTYVSDAGSTITVSSDDGSDLMAWWPDQRAHIQIVQADGTQTRAEITAWVDNGDGTMTLTHDGGALSASEVEMISWLELCRFEEDTFEITWYCHEFKLETKARVVRE